jgi:nucleotide-binding universal stress UspA family protein
MFDRLLVAVDHSPHRERVLALAKDLAVLSGGEVFLIHVREREVMGRGGFPAEEDTDEAREPVTTAQDVLTKAGVKVHGEIVEALHGHAAKEILRLATAYDASIIVMGTRGHNELESLLVGSTTHKVLHHADRPVLVVP